jgi:hypothetical protein
MSHSWYPLIQGAMNKGIYYSPHKRVNMNASRFWWLRRVYSKLGFIYNHIPSGYGSQKRVLASLINVLYFVQSGTNILSDIKIFLVLLQVIWLYNVFELHQIGDVNLYAWYGL